MPSRSVLVIGGTGEISAACCHRAVELGMDVTALNRGRTTARPLPSDVRVVTADIRDAAGVTAAVGAEEFDVVANFLVFTADHVGADIDRFAGRTGQYVFFISSASAYQKPIARLPITESTPLGNPVWPYSQAKIRYRTDAARRAGRGARRRHLAVDADAQRRLRGRLRRTARQPAGDRRGGAHHIRRRAHLEPDPRDAAAAAGAEPRLVHVASETIFAHDEEWGRSLLGDKAHSVIFDNSKVRGLVPDFRPRI